MVFLLCRSTESVLCKREGIQQVWGSRPCRGIAAFPLKASLEIVLCCVAPPFCFPWVLEREVQAGCILGWASGNYTASSRQGPKKSITGTVQNPLVQPMIFLLLGDLLPLEVMFCSVVLIFLSKALMQSSIIIHPKVSDSNLLHSVLGLNWQLT